HRPARPGASAAGGQDPGRETAMKLRQARDPGRQAFTLVELLVVIAIIAILAGLTTAAVMNVFGKGPHAKCENDIRQLQTGLENFKNKFGSYPPGRVKLCKLYSMYNVTGDQLDQDSVAFLMKMFPRIDLNIWNGTGIDWSGGTVPGFTQAVLE